LSVPARNGAFPASDTDCGTGTAAAGSAQGEGEIQKMSQVLYGAATRTESRTLAPRDNQPTMRLASGTSGSSAGAAVEVASVSLHAEPAAVEELAQCLSEEERLRAGRFVFARDRRRFIVARAWLRRLLASRLGVQPEGIQLTYGPRGKPALRRNLADSDLRFNVSHSEDLAVYAFARGREIGIDVEAVRQLEDADAIAARFFSVRENSAYRALDSNDKPLGFFNCWTRKEAFIKALGDGLYCPLDSFDVSLAPGEPARILRVSNAPGDRCGWHLESFSPNSGFVAAVVTAVAKQPCAS
jgi:4'-phosphopantetheinyl transferase